MENNYKNLNERELLDLEKMVLEQYYEVCKKDYLAYVEYVNYPNFIVGKHTKFVCNAVQEVVEGRRFLADGRKVRIMIITEPPQHGKSMKLTEALPAWVLGKYPYKRVIEASYNQEFAMKFGRSNLDKMQRFGKDIFGVALAEHPQTALEFKTHMGGGMISRGYMTGITGNPGDIIIIDDPIKNRQEADSVTDRETKWNEYLSVIRARLSADGIIFVILTRWHEDDIAGRIIERESLPVEVIRIPLEAEEGDILGRKVGDPLFPEIGKDAAWLKEFKRAYIEDPSDGGIRAWNALYQCRPSSLAGNIFMRDWWKYWIPEGWNPKENLVTVQLINGTYANIEPVILPKTFNRQLQSWDLTFKNGDGVDNVAGGVLGTSGASIFLLDAVYSPMSFVQTISAILAMTQKWKDAVLKYIEDKANGSAVESMLQQKVQGIVMVEPKGSKVERAAASSPLVEAGNVYLPHPKLYPWVNTLINQMSDFPNAAHDDFVDMMSQALLKLMYSHNVEKPKDRTMVQKHKEALMRERLKPQRKKRGVLR